MSLNIFSEIARKEKWTDRFFRFGLICKGIVYCLIGLITVLAALGLSREEAGKEDVLKFLYDQPFGRVLLIFISLGLFGYVTLRFFQSVKDIDQKGKDADGLLSRIGYAISGLLYLGLGFYAGKLAFGYHGEDNSSRFILTRILTFPWGAWAIGLGGIIIIGSGFYQIYRAVSGKFMKKITLVRSGLDNTVQRAGMAGYISRGIVLILVGYLVLHAAMTSNPDGVKGTEGAFRFIENRFGSILMGIVALGMFTYGIFMFVKARYQRIRLE